MAAVEGMAEMSLYKRGSYWHYDFYFDGVRHQGSTRQKRLREAERIVDAMKADLARSKFALPHRSLPFQEMADRYSEYASVNKPSFVTEKYHLRKHLVPYFQCVTLAAINLELCEKYKRKRLAAGAEKATINRELTTLKSVLKYASECGVAPEALGRHARLFAGVESKTKHVLTVEELDRLVEVCNSLEFQVRAPYLGALIILAAYTGLRSSELVRLRWADLDLDNGRLRVRKSKTRSGIREIPMKAIALDILRKHRVEVDNAWVFPSPRKPGAHLKDFGKAFEAAVRKAGLHDVSPGCLRHTFCTWVEASEPRRSIIRELCGHSRDRHTDNYLHPGWKDKAGAIERLPVPAGLGIELQKESHGNSGGRQSESYPHHASWEDKPAAIERLPLPAKFTTADEGSNKGVDSEGPEPCVPEGIRLVGPSGVEPLTSTVSR